MPAPARRRAGRSTPRTARIPIGRTLRSRERSRSARRCRCPAGSPRRRSHLRPQGLEAYINYANENDLLPGYELELTIGDDQYDPALTPGVVNGLIDDGVHLFAGNIGTQNNLAVRDTLNEECIPQLNVLAGDPRFGEVADFPWTTGLLTSYEYEYGAYAQDIAANFPDSTVGLFYVNSEFGNISIGQLPGSRRRRRARDRRRGNGGARRRSTAAGPGVEPRRRGPEVLVTVPSAPSASRSSTSWPTPRRPMIGLRSCT